MILSILRLYSSHSYPPFSNISIKLYTLCFPSASETLCYLLVWGHTQFFSVLNGSWWCGPSMGGWVQPNSGWPSPGKVCALSAVQSLRTLYPQILFWNIAEIFSLEKMRMNINAHLCSRFFNIMKSPPAINNLYFMANYYPLTSICWHLKGKSSAQKE